MTPNCVGCGRFTAFKCVPVYSAFQWSGVDRYDWYCAGCAEKAGVAC